MSREQIDKITWQAIHARSSLAAGDDRGGRPGTIGGLASRLDAGEDFEHAWSNFLHAFYDYRTASFFA